jgi:hypothetical protein
LSLFPSTRDSSLSSSGYVLWQLTDRLPFLHFLQQPFVNLNWSCFSVCCRLVTTSWLGRWPSLWLYVITLGTLSRFVNLFLVWLKG